MSHFCTLVTAGLLPVFLFSSCRSSGSQKDEGAELSLPLEYDLTQAGAVFSGVHVRGPGGSCRVVPEGTSAVRLSCEGPPLLKSVQTGENGFDLRVESGHEDLVRYRLARARRWAKRALFGAHKLLSGTSELLAWREGERIHTYHFLMLRTLDGRPFTCGTTPLRGAGNELEYRAHLASCKSLSIK